MWSRSQRTLCTWRNSTKRYILPAISCQFQHETVLEELVKINGNTDKAELAYNIALTSVSEELICEQEAIISRLVADTNQASRVIRDILKGMAETTIELEKWAPPGSGDLRIRQMKEVALGQKFSRAMSRSQETQRRANTRQQEQMKRQYKIGTASLLCSDGFGSEARCGRRRAGEGRRGGRGDEPDLAADLQHKPKF